MDSSRFLIIGAYGQLGKALRAKYPEAVALDRDDFDMTDWQMVSNYDWSKFDVILNAAAYTNVDGAETAEGRAAAWKINAIASGYLSVVASRRDITLIHVSSEYVFDGSKSPHNENESLTPLGVYAQTKAAGDIAVSTTPKHYILRTSWLIGDGPNFVRTMKNLAEKGISPSVVDDQTGRLTFTDTLVGAIDHLLQTKAAYGLYNVSNSGDVVSWAGIAKKVYQLCGRSASQVTGVTTAQYFADKLGAAPRPLLSKLDLTKLKSISFKPGDWQVELEDYLKTSSL